MDDEGVEKTKVKNRPSMTGGSSSRASFVLGGLFLARDRDYVIRGDSGVRDAAGPPKGIVTPGEDERRMLGLGVLIGRSTDGSA